MKTLVGLVGLLALFIMPVAAQDSTTPPQDQAPTAPTEPVKVKKTYPTPKAEISGGFTIRGYYGSNGSTTEQPH